MAEVVARCRQRCVLVHVDAVSAAGHVPCDLGALDADLVSVSAHVMGGPTGIGALILRRGLRIEPFVVGGDQERARRAGMEHVAGAIGFGAAAAWLARPGMLGDEASAALGRTDRLLVLKKPFHDIEVMQLASTLAEKWNLGRQAALKFEQRFECMERLAERDGLALAGLAAGQWEQLWGEAKSLTKKHK